MVARLPYPKELRVRVVAAVEQGELTQAEIARLFGVGVTFIKKMLGWQRAGPDLAPRQGGGPVARLQAPELAWLRTEVAQHPAATRAELQTALAAQGHGTASLPTLCRALQQLALPRKKKASSTRSAMSQNAKSSGR